MNKEPVDDRFRDMILNPDRVDELYEAVFSSWMRTSGLTDFRVSAGRVSARLPFSQDLLFVGGTICGQAIAGVADTTIAMAMISLGTGHRGTSYLHTHFLRPGTEDLLIEAEVLRSGATTAYAECHMRLASTNKLAVHAVAEFIC
ncbi:MAG: PaaI family thioesterase [Parvularculaceae bacterium]|nr:PaaI family thioesterase [Parvularculaceae bacterium]